MISPWGTMTGSPVGAGAQPEWGSQPEATALRLPREAVGCRWQRDGSMASCNFLHMCVSLLKYFKSAANGMGRDTKRSPRASRLPGVACVFDLRVTWENYYSLKVLLASVWVFKLEKKLNYLVFFPPQIMLWLKIWSVFMDIEAFKLCFQSSYVITFYE